MPTAIEWTDETWNPLRGCTRVSPGCGGPGPHGGCYAEAIAARFSDPGQAYHGLAVRTPKGGRWTGKVELVAHLLDAPLRWRRPRKIFVNSMSDLFHESVPDEWIDRVFAVMALAPQHIFQVLTKRPERMRAWFARYDAAHDHNCADFVADAIARQLGREGATGADRTAGHDLDWPLPNVWLGVSVEDQQRADERIPQLLATPAAVRWLSMEPLLSGVSLRCISWTSNRGFVDALTGQTEHAEVASRPHAAPLANKLDWIVVGGESGANARPMHPNWARLLRDQCAAAGVPFFFKQWGEWAPEVGAVDGWTIGDDTEISKFEHRDWLGDHWSAPFSRGWQDDIEPDTVSRIGKKRAGRLLDGVQHDGVPA